MGEVESCRDTKIKELRLKLQKHVADKISDKKPHTPPRYDEVYFEGVAELDKL